MNDEDKKIEQMLEKVNVVIKANLEKMNRSQLLHTLEQHELMKKGLEAGLRNVEETILYIGICLEILKVVDRQ